MSTPTAEELLHEARGCDFGDARYLAQRLATALAEVERLREAVKDAYAAGVREAYGAPPVLQEVPPQADIPADSAGCSSGSGELEQLRQRAEAAEAQLLLHGYCESCGCAREQCEGYGAGRKCCPDCKHRGSIQEELRAVREANARTKALREAHEAMTRDMALWRQRAEKAEAKVELWKTRFTGAETQIGLLRRAHNGEVCVDTMEENERLRAELKLIADERPELINAWNRLLSHRDELQLEVERLRAFDYTNEVMAATADLRQRAEAAEADVIKWRGAWEIENSLRMGAEAKLAEAQQREAQLIAAVRLVLLFHGAGPWDDSKRAQWLQATGVTEATTKVMCDHLRAALGLDGAQR